MLRWSNNLSNNLYASRTPRQTGHTTKNNLRQIFRAFMFYFYHAFLLIADEIYSYFTILVFPVPHMPVISKLWPSLALANENSRLLSILTALVERNNFAGKKPEVHDGSKVQKFNVLMFIHEIVDRYSLLIGISSTSSHGQK